MKSDQFKDQQLKIKMIDRFSYLLNIDPSVLITHPNYSKIITDCLKGYIIIIDTISKDVYGAIPCQIQKNLHGGASE